MREVGSHLALEREMASNRSWTEIFHGMDRKRTHIALLVLLSIALTGIQFVIPYTALFLANLGLTNPYVLNVAISSCSKFNEIYIDLHQADGIIYLQSLLVLFLAHTLLNMSVVVLA